MSTIKVTNVSHPSAASPAIVLDAAGGVVSNLVPQGTVMYFAMNTAPSGWLKANGAQVSRTTYASLFSAISTVFGAGDGSTTFTLPDLRGEFIRGWDDGRSVDTGRTFGSAQSGEIQSHSHQQQVQFSNYTHSHNSGSAQSASAMSGGAGGLTGYSAGGISASGGSETRPRNIALLACIRY
jgi:microcystin-dependent protein